MVILAIRTDKPLAEIALFNNGDCIETYTWEAHRQLAETLHQKIQDVLKKNNFDWSDVRGLVIYQGPGSFTGLRIGLSVVNALAASLSAAIVGETGDHWQADGLARLRNGEDQQLVMPEYGAPVHITQQRK